MSRRNGRKAFPARPTAKRKETIDAQGEKNHQTIPSPLLARAAGVVRRRGIRALSPFAWHAGEYASSAYRRRVLRRTARPALLSPQPLLLGFSEIGIVAVAASGVDSR